MKDPYKGTEPWRLILLEVGILLLAFLLVLLGNR